VRRDQAAQRQAVRARDSGPRKRASLTGEAGLSSRRRRKRRVPVLAREELGRGPFLGPGQNGAPGLFFLFLFLPFLFPDFQFFYIFCIRAPIQIKQGSKIL
jgi:hypothetical protein